MVFNMVFHNEGGVNLPLNYNHMLAGLIYNILSDDPQYSEILHNHGYEYATSCFKCFTFSGPHGETNISGRTIYFNGDISWEVRSPDPYFCTIFLRHLEENSMYRIGKNTLRLKEFDFSDAKIFGSKKRIHMITPIVVSHTVDKKTIYHNPLEKEYSEYINNNFEKKFNSAYGQDPPSGIELLPEAIGYRDKVVTKYEDKIWVEGWKGKYIIKGNPISIKFLYETGLGGRNAQGFGMFEIL